MKKIGICIMLIIISTTLIGCRDESTEVLPWDQFIEKSYSGEICQTEIVSEGDEILVISFDGEKYTAERNDGSRGTGKYLLELKGRWPSAALDTTITIISDTEYSFEDVSKDIFDSNSTNQLDYFLIAMN